MPRFRVPLFAAILSLFSFTASAQVQILNETYRNSGKTSVNVEAVFAPSSQQGSMPFLITINNNSGKDRTWTVKIYDGQNHRKLSTDITETISVENGASITREVYLPVPPIFTTYSYRNVSVEVSSPGLNNLSRSVGHETNDNSPTLAISKALARRSISDLDDHIQNRGASDKRFALPFLPEHLPVNWRGYTGLDGLLIDKDSWDGLDDAQERAVLEWVRLGGRLDIFTTETPANGKKLAVSDLKIGGLSPFKRNPSSARLSLGMIHLRNWDGDHLDVAVTTQFKSTPHRADELDSHYDRAWSLRTDFGDKKFNPAIILIPLLIFAIIVAPVNLFHFAKKGQRHRLFFTTPIISVVACIVIVAIIFLEDGLGGRGYRAILADIQSQPGEMRVYLTQEQVSRTGVMLQSGFDPEVDLTIDPVNLPRSVFNPLSNSSNRNTEYHFYKDHLGGGFFRSRSEQGFSIRSTQPTRARIEIIKPATDATTPSLVSSLPVAVSQVYFRDGDGNTWRSPRGYRCSPGKPYSSGGNRGQRIYRVGQRFNDCFQPFLTSANSQSFQRTSSLLRNPKIS